MASTDQAMPHTMSSWPPMIAVRALALAWPSLRLPSWPAVARPGATCQRAMMIIRMPIAATVKPWSSLTKTSGSAQATAARVRPRISADSENASRGTANAISWKSKLIICCRPQEKP